MTGGGGVGLPPPPSRGLGMTVVEMTDGLDYRRAFAAHVSSNPRVAEWERLMKSLQEPSPDAAAGEWWAVMEPVFRLEDQEPAIARAVDRSTS